MLLRVNLNTVDSLFEGKLKSVWLAYTTLYGHIRIKLYVTIELEHEDAP